MSSKNEKRGKRKKKRKIGKRKKKGKRDWERKKERTRERERERERERRKKKESNTIEGMNNFATRWAQCLGPEIWNQILEAGTVPKNITERSKNSCDSHLGVV